MPPPRRKIRAFLGCRRIWRGLLARLQRFERHGEPERAAARWNELVSARTQRLGPPSPEAREQLISIRGLPAGTRSWAAWYAADPQVLVGVYLLHGQKTADILEELQQVPAEDSSVR